MFLNHEDGCVMRQRVDVPNMKLTQRKESSTRGRLERDSGETGRLGDWVGE